MKKIVLCGGGTAGHVYPALAVAEKLKCYEIHYFGGSGMEKDILKNFPNITYHEIPVVKLERKLTLKNLLIPIKLIKSISETKRELKSVSPDVIFSKGGFVSVPVAIAGKKLNIPVISHESDLSFGLANKIILRNCDVMCTTFEETGKGSKKCVHTGQPIRQRIFQGKKLPLFKNNLPTILVLGGSLGAKFLNDIVSQNLTSLTKKYNIIHICGKKNYEEISHNSNLKISLHNPNYHLIPFAENIQDYYATADIVIARAGSGVINELLSLCKPMLLVPLSKKCSRGDQIENAKLFTKKSYALMLEEEDFSYAKLELHLEKLSKSNEIFIKNMKKNAKNNSCDQIFEIIEKYAKKKTE